MGYTREELEPFQEDIRRCKAIRSRLEHRTKGGETFPAEVRAALVELEWQENICTMVLDITKRVEAEGEALDFVTASKRRERWIRQLIAEATDGKVGVAELLDALALE